MDNKLVRTAAKAAVTAIYRKKWKGRWKNGGEAAIFPSSLPISMRTDRSGDFSRRL